MKLGDVVRFIPTNGFGVVVRLPLPGYDRYRVRISTESWSRYVEVGALPEELETEPAIYQKLRGV